MLHRTHKRYATGPCARRARSLAARGRELLLDAEVAPSHVDDLQALCERILLEDRLGVELLLAQLAMPWLIFGLASGFAGQQEFTLSVEFGRIAFPYVLFISLAALFSGLLNATGRFAAAAAAPVLLNVLLVGSMTVAAAVGGDVARALIWAIPVAGVAQLALVWGAARQAGFGLRLSWPRFSPDMGRLLRIAVPAALASGVVQINLLVGGQVARQSAV